jgi:SAM-dependent methyltransferase
MVARMAAPPPTLGASVLRRMVHRIVPEDIRPRVTRLYRPLMLRGTDVACPVCERQFRRFLDHRDQPNVRCPWCGSMERHRLLWLWLTNETDFFTASITVLHFAPELALLQRLEKQSNLDYRTTDLESRIADEHFDITDIPYADGSVDVILCNHVLEHIPDDRRAMSELHRILRPGGWAVLMTPIGKNVDVSVEGAADDPAERLERFGQEDHVRLYGQDFYARLREAGFAVDVHDYTSTMPAEAVERYRLKRDHLVFEDDLVVIGRKSG